jgi:anti-sigma B factor antagonist
MSEHCIEHRRRPDNRLRLIDGGADGAAERARLEALLAPLRAPLLTVEHHLSRGVEVFAARGEIDISTAARLVDALRPAVQQARRDVLVDLSDVTFMASTGVQLLLRTFKQLQAQQRRLAVACSDGGTVHRVLSLSGVLGILSVHPSRDAALNRRDEQPTDAIAAGASIAVAQPLTPDDTLAHDSVLRDISRALVRVYKRQLGRGPTTIRANWAGPDVLVVTLEETLTQTERTMRTLGQHKRLRDIRTVMQQAEIQDLCDPVEAATGRKIRAFLSAIDITADVATETFVLHAEGYDGPSRTQHER